MSKSTLPRARTASTVASEAASFPATHRSDRPKALSRVLPNGRARLLGLDRTVRAAWENALERALEGDAEIDAAIAGPLRALAPVSAPLRAAMAEAFVRIPGGDLARADVRRLPAFGIATIRALAEAGDAQVVELLYQALQEPDGGGAAVLSAACFASSPKLAAPLARVAASPKSHLAFAAGVARAVRGDAQGGHLAELAPKIKESHRIAFATELFLPLVRTPPRTPALAPALQVLRGAERHLGRWLVLAEVAVGAGDREPFDDASVRAMTGPESARGAFSLLAWALGRRLGRGTEARVRPTIELVSRLSDRPSADRDLTFLFRLADAGAPVAKSMLESLAKAPFVSAQSIRAAFYLARDHGRDDLRGALRAAASEPRPEGRGLLAAALSDLGEDGALALGEELASDRCTSRGAFAAASGSSWTPGPDSAWGALVTVRDPTPIFTEQNIRWIERGWLE